MTDQPKFVVVVEVSGEAAQTFVIDRTATVTEMFELVDSKPLGLTRSTGIGVRSVRVH